MMLLTAITLFCFMLRAETQTSEIQNLHAQAPVINPDYIYFQDNRPNFTKVNIPAVDSYLPATERSNTRQDHVNQQVLSQSSQVLSYQVPQPSRDLQPPNSAESIPNYYAPNYNHDAHRLSVTVRVDQLANEEEYGFNSLQEAVTNFGINLMKSVTDIQSSGNVVVSPFSIATLLALVQQGALGVTRDELSRVLQMTPEAAAANYHKINNDVQSRSSRNILKIASNIFIADSFVMTPTFKSVAIKSFGSAPTLTSFAKSDEASMKINNWVASKTNDKINKLVTADSIGINTQMVLVNAVYFKGLWDMKFHERATIPQKFHLGDGTKKMVPFMQARRYFRTGVDKDINAKVITLPFENQEYSLVVILPFEGSSVRATLAGLTDAKLAGYQNLTAVEVKLELPKFTVKADTNLLPVLRKMGVNGMFGTQSELSGIGTYRTLSPQVSSAVHSAVLSIDETGGSAAAATAFTVVALSNDDPSVIFKANRPFLAILWDNIASIPLFMAKIEDPSL